MKKPLVLAMFLLLLLFAACGRRGHSSGNPLLDVWEEPYGFPPFGQIRGGDYLPALEAAIVEHNGQLSQIAGEKAVASFDNVILALDSSGSVLDRTVNLYRLKRMADADEDFCSQAEDIAAMLAGHDDKIYLDDALFDRVRQVYDRRESMRLDSMKLRLTELTYDRFIRSGALLGAAEKDTLRRINEELARLQANFGCNLRGALAEAFVTADSTQVAGLPFHIKDTTSKLASAAGMPGKFRFVAQDPIVAATLTYASDRKLRDDVYRMWTQSGSTEGQFDNRPLVERILSLRARKASVLGYGTYAAYQMPERMAGSVGEVYSVLDSVWVPACEKAREETVAMIGRFLAGDSSSLRPSDLQYFMNNMLKTDFDINQELLDVYFTLENVRQGAFELANRLFGLTFRPVQPEMYSRDCDVFQVYNADNSLLGFVVFDYYPRPGKETGSHTLLLRSRNPRAIENSEPVACALFNFSRPGTGRPSILPFSDVHTMFRSFGDALSMLFIDVPYRGLQRPAIDLSGLLGELMSDLALTPQVLRRYAVHYNSAKPIHEIMVGNLTLARNIGSGWQTVSLEASAYMDIDVHTLSDPIPEAVEAFEHGRMAGRGMPTGIAPKYRLPEFVQVFDGPNAAGFYSRVWSAVLSADVIAAFTASGELLNREMAGSLREKVLSQGCSRSAAEMYHDFRGNGIQVVPYLIRQGFSQPQPSQGEHRRWIEQGPEETKFPPAS